LDEILRYRRYKKLIGCHLISRAHLRVKHLCLKPLAKNKKPRKQKKKDAKDPNAIKGQKNFTRGQI
jgi:hypothetical protein